MKIWNWVIVGSVAVCASLLYAGIPKPSLTVRSLDPSLKILGARYYHGTNYFSYHYGKHARLFSILDRWSPRFAGTRKNPMVANGKGPALVVYFSSPVVPTPAGWNGPPIHSPQTVDLFNTQGEQAWQMCNGLDEIGFPTNSVMVYYGALSNGLYHLRYLPRGANVADIRISDQP